MKTNEALIVSIQLQRDGYDVFFRWRCDKCNRVNSQSEPRQFSEFVSCGSCGSINCPEEVFITKRIASFAC